MLSPPCPFHEPSPKQARANLQPRRCKSRRDEMLVNTIPCVEYVVGSNWYCLPASSRMTKQDALLASTLLVHLLNRLSQSFYIPPIGNAIWVSLAGPEVAIEKSSSYTKPLKSLNRQNFDQMRRKSTPSKGSNKATIY